MPLRNQLADFSQVDVMAGRSNAAATEGACHNFSMHWVSLMYADGTQDGAQTRMRTLGVGRGEANPVLQKIFGQEWTRQGVDAADRMISAIRGLTLVRDLIAYSAYNRGSLVNELDTTDVSGMLYSFWFAGSVTGAGGGAHTIAFFRNVQSRRGATAKSDDTVVAFDPNFGECWIPEGLVGAWMDDMLAHYGPCQYQWLKAFKPSR